MDLSTIVLPASADEQPVIEGSDVSNQGINAEDAGIQQPGDIAASQRDSERFYCPYPGCNRSFAELWRLKVHYRAPPDIRGSGKERGHGTELGFCPKCGKALKPGKHHVGCSAGRATPRQTKRKAAEDGSNADGTKRQESLPQPYPWMDPATAQAAAQAAAAAAAAAAGMPLNGGHYPPLIPPHLAMPGYPQAPDGSGYYSQHHHHHAAAAAAVAAAAAAFASPYGPGYPPQFGVPGFPPMPPGAYPPPYPGAPPPPHGMVQQHQQHQQHQQAQHQQPLPQLPAPPQPQQQLSGGQPTPPPSSQQQPPQPPEHQDGFNKQQRSSHSTPATSAVESSEPEFLAGIFDDLPEFNRVVPSPPPLPQDFHVNSGPNRLLFNFSQFSHKMPHSLHDAHAKDLTDKEALDLAEQHVVYDHTDDGELMQMLFGMADDMPTMATIHLHAWHNVDDETMQQQQQAQMGVAESGAHNVQGSSSQLPTRDSGSSQQRPDARPQTSMSGPASTSQHHGQGQDGQRQTGHAANGQTPGPVNGEAKKLDGSTGDFMSKHLDILGNCGDERDHVLEAEMHQFLQSVE